MGEKQSDINCYPTHRGEMVEGTWKSFLVCSFNTYVTYFPFCTTSPYGKCVSVCISYCVESECLQQTVGWRVPLCVERTSLPLKLHELFFWAAKHTNLMNLQNMITLTNCFYSGSSKMQDTYECSYNINPWTSNLIVSETCFTALWRLALQSAGLLFDQQNIILFLKFELMKSVEVDILYFSQYFHTVSALHAIYLHTVHGVVSECPLYMVGGLSVPAHSVW